MYAAPPTPAAPVLKHPALRVISPAVLTFALFSLLIFAVIFPTMRRNIVERKKEMIRELTHAAWSELARAHELERAGTLTREAAQRTAAEQIRGLHYGGDNKDYFWITDLHPRMIMHPYRRELEGTDLTGYADPAGKRLFVECARLVREQREGYVEYQWQWKDDDTRVVPKLSYVKGFEPWGWIVGTGVYLEDVREEIQAMTRTTLRVSIGILLAVAALLTFISVQGVRLERRRVRAETALRASEEKYRLLVEGFSEGMLLVVQDHPVYANRILLDRTGWRADELEGMPLDRILESAQGAGPPGGEGERRARLFDRNGGGTDVLVVEAPVRIGDRDGRILVVKDIAARRNTEETLARLVADLQSLLPLATRAIKSTALSTARCPLDASMQQAAAIMARSDAGAILVHPAGGGEPVGIVTDEDLRTRVLAEGLSPREPVASVMTSPIPRIGEEALLFEAARMMRERKVRYLAVTGGDGAIRGVLSGEEVLHAQGHAMGALLAEIRSADSPEAARDSRAKLPVFVKALLESGARVESVTRIMTAVSDATLARLVELAQRELGPAPVPFAFVVLGSEARGEQTLVTDQDNALLYADPPAGAEEETAAWFLRLGVWVCAALDRVGYRRCAGGVMASNPKWCQPASTWRDTFTACLESPTPQDLLDVNIFFDFRCGHGDATLVRDLRAHLRGLVESAERHVFFFHLAQTTLQFKPPRGFFGNLQFQSSGEGEPTFNIKAAIIPIVNFARIYALRHGLSETNTLERLRQLRDRGLLLPSSAEELVQAYTALMQMRLAHQAGQIGRGVEPDNLIRPGELSQIERSVLKKVFAEISVFQARLETDFARTA